MLLRGDFFPGVRNPMRARDSAYFVLAVLTGLACGGGESGPETDAAARDLADEALSSDASISAAAPDAPLPDALPGERPTMDRPASDTDPDGAAPDRPADVSFDVLPPLPLVDGGAPTLLSKAGLYTDIARKLIDPAFLPFEPAHELWSDGAVKRRWIYLPPGTTIDTSDMDHWRFPVGTRIFKEFSRDGLLLETRLIERTGPGDNDFLMGAFVWEPDGSDALFREEGQENINGTDHDAPSSKLCVSCHGGEPGRVLGISALQLSKAGPGLTLASLIEQGRLAPAPPASASFPAPGDAATSAALGYLHANCGHCHSRTGLAFRETDLVLRLFTNERTAEQTALVRSSVGINMQKFRTGSAVLRVSPGDPEGSGVIFRMRSRERNEQMPPLATKHAHPFGLDLVSTWIRTLEPR
jgi:hypothetical protein